MRPIDADALIEKCGGWYVEEGTESGFIGTLKNLLATEPTIQPQPKEGHWKKDESDDCPIVFQQFRICSVCGTIEMSETNYCPHCGAKMTISK